MAPLGDSHRAFTPSAGFEEDCDCPGQLKAQKSSPLAPPGRCASLSHPPWLGTQGFAVPGEQPWEHRPDLSLGKWDLEGWQGLPRRLRAQPRDLPGVTVLHRQPPVPEGSQPGGSRGGYGLCPEQRLLSRDSRGRHSSFPAPTPQLQTARKPNHNLQKISKRLENLTQATIGGPAAWIPVRQLLRSRGNPAPNAAMALTAVISPAI